MCEGMNGKEQSGPFQKNNESGGMLTNKEGRESALKHLGGRPMVSASQLLIGWEVRERSAMELNRCYTSTGAHRNEQ